MLEIVEEPDSSLDKDPNIKALLVNSGNMAELLKDKKNLEALKQLSKKKNFAANLKTTI